MRSDTLLLRCSSLPEYCASILDRAELTGRIGDFVPILANKSDTENGRDLLDRQNVVFYPGSSSLSPLSHKPDAAASDELIEHALGESVRIKNSWHCCVVARDDIFAPFGAAYALLTGKRLLVANDLSDFEDKLRELRSASSATVILSPQKCAVLGMDQLVQTIQGEPSNRSGTSWGLITASDQVSLTRVAARQLIESTRARRARVYASNSEWPVQLDDPELEFLSSPNHPDPAFGSIVAKPIAFSAFIGHGRSYCALSGNLCSYDEPLEPGDHRCVGGYECMYSSWPRLPASRIASDVTFIDSCWTASFESQGPDQNQALSLALRVLAGSARAVISPYRTVAPLPASALLLWSFLKQGLSLGTVVALLNKYVGAYAPGPGPYILLGDPELVLSSRAEASEELLLAPEAPGIARVIVPRRVASVSRFRLRGNALSGTGRLYCLIEPAKMQSYRAEIVPGDTADDSRELLVIGPVPDGSNPITILITDAPPVSEDVTRSATNFLKNWSAQNFIPCTRKSDATLQALANLNEAWSRLEPELLTIQRRPIAHTAQYLYLSQQGECLAQLCAAVDRSLLVDLASHARGHAFWVQEEYAETSGLGRAVASHTPRPCPRCGGSLQIIKYNVGLSAGAARVMGECSTCTVVYDVPVYAPGIALYGPRSASRGEQFEAEIRGQGSGPGLQRFFAAISLDLRGYSADLFAVSPDVCEIEAEEGAFFTMRFDVKLSADLPIHMFHLKGLLVNQASLSWVLHKIEVR